MMVFFRESTKDSLIGPFTPVRIVRLKLFKITLSYNLRLKLYENESTNFRLNFRRIPITVFRKTSINIIDANPIMFISITPDYVRI